MLVDEMRAALAAAPRERLCDLSKALWQALAAGAVSEADAEALSGLIEARRAVGANLPDGKDASRSLFQARTMIRRPQRPPVRSAAIERRRRLAASGPMPPALAARFTTAELAALKIISDDVRSSGACMLPIDAIAARAGVSRTSVQNAIRRAVYLGMLERQERRRAYDRSLPSILRIVDREWSMWLKRGPKGGGLNSSSTTGKEIHKGRFERAELVKGCRGAEFDSRRSDRPRIRAGRGAG